MSISSIIKKTADKLIPTKLKAAARTRKEKKVFSEGYDNFLKTGKTSQEVYQSLIYLYCNTNGRFNDEMHDRISKSFAPVKPAAELKGVLGVFNTNDFNVFDQDLKKNGYAFFDKKIPSETIRKLNDFALKTSALTAPNYDKKIIYDEKNPVSEIYRFDMQDLMNNETIQELVMDPVLINVARNYLGCEPIFDFPAMWWSTSYLKEASSEAAQLYHFDMDRIKWLKVFIYLNDVTPENGPHCYIRGTHLTGAKPQNLIERGYVRIKDEELQPHFSKEKFVEVCAESGAVFAGDTKCWHKGSPLKKGHRLVLEFEYTGSMFGANYPKLEIKNYSEAFKKFCDANKRYASNIHFSNQ